jgi:hypothetical protein
MLGLPDGHFGLPFMATVQIPPYPLNEIVEYEMFELFVFVELLSLAAEFVHVLQTIVFYSIRAANARLIGLAAAAAAAWDRHIHVIHSGFDDSDKVLLHNGSFMSCRRD